MSAQSPPPVSERDAAEQRHGDVWPGPSYEAQVLALKASVGKTVYLVEVQQSDLHLAVQYNHKPLELLAVVDFPRPDPVLGLLPHMLVLSDGRGLNLGRIARVALEQPFVPPPEAVLYHDAPLLKALVLGERLLSSERIAAISRWHLAAALGPGGVKTPLLGE